MEHRWGRRQPIDLMVQFSAVPGKIGIGRLVNISSSGAFMETAMPLRPLSVVHLGRASIPLGETRGNAIAASVVRQNAMGVGLEWCDSGGEVHNVNTRLTRLADAREMDQIRDDLASLSPVPRS